MIELGTKLKKVYIEKNNKRMAYGYTTGSCAAAAARAATELLLTGNAPEEVSLMTPKGFLLRLVPEESYLDGDRAVCAIRKDGGDDPDATHGCLIYSSVKRIPGEDIVIDGGIGVGRVTRAGLEQNIGDAAINRVPRKMIFEAVDSVREETGYAGGLSVVIFVPDGEKIAKRTFNPKLGIMGGISILGTSGIVVPMSEDSLIASIRLEMSQRAAQGEKYLLVVPGNYGETFIKENPELELEAENLIKCSNYVGETIDMAVELGLDGLLFVSHIGKIVKVAGGIMNTHSRAADCRMEILAAHSLLAGADAEVCREILKAPTTDAGLTLMEEAGVLEAAMRSIMDKILEHFEHRSYGRLKIAALTFSKERGELGRTRNFEEIRACLREQERCEYE